MSPKYYWPFVLIAFAVKYTLVVLTLEKPEWKDLKSDWASFFVAAIVGQRMQDFGVSSRWGWVGVALISFALPVGAVFLWPQPHDAAHPLDVLPPSVGIVATLLLLGLIVAVGRKKGDTGPNRFGEAPL